MALKYDVESQWRTGRRGQGAGFIAEKIRDRSPTRRHDRGKQVGGADPLTLVDVGREVPEDLVPAPSCPEPLVSRARGKLPPA